jgi:hypothetical protein
MNSLTFSIQPLKCQVSAVTRALFNLSAHCKTAFSLSGEKYVHLMGQHCASHYLKVKVNGNTKNPTDLVDVKINLL